MTNETYNIIVQYINNNRSFVPLKAKGVTIHDTGNVWGDTDEGNFSWFNRAYRAASAHVFLDVDSIRQFIPFNEKAWHAGPTANRQFIGVELCNATNQNDFNIIYAKGVWVVAKIFVEELRIYKVTKDNLPSHREVSLKWNETDHMDPDDYLEKYGKSVDMFRRDVQNKIKEMQANAKSTTIFYKKGDKGEHIQEVQVLLNKNGEDLVIDGDYGSKTFNAVLKFQKANGLGQTGMVDKKTLEYLKNKDKFKDHDDISSWALEAVEWGKNLGIIKGNGQGFFNPQGQLTREALMVVLYNYHMSQEK